MLLQAWYVILFCVTILLFARRKWLKRAKRCGLQYAPVPSSSSRLAQELTQDALLLAPSRCQDPPRLVFFRRIERYLPEHISEHLRCHWVRNDLVQQALPAGTWWPELLVGLEGEPRFAGAQASTDALPERCADAEELLRRVQEILEACKDPTMHEALDGLSIRCVLENPPHHFVWFAEAPGSPVPFVVSETVIRTTLPIDAVLWSIYSPQERLKWDQSPFVAHEILHTGGVQSTAFRDFLYSRVTIAPGISDRDLVQERFLTQLPDQSGYAILMCSCSDEIAARLGRPDTTNVVRTKDLLSAYILQPRENGIRLMTLSQKDVGSHVPSFFQHMARSVGKRKPLEMAQQLERHCRR